ncbi:MAG TPA: VIT1/CCC1 transporter family protein [Candidatus Paceibacterota bacterium]|nr:VIT1/CCC1 transporter family protein [Candidatus Paceibacterota bacterium]
MTTPQTKSMYLRNFVFGVEDSLVSTVGLLSGVAIGGMAQKEILLTGIVLIFVEAISMAAGSFLSESSAEEYETRQDTNGGRGYPSAAIMFISYFLSGFIPLAPYVFLPITQAFPTSIVLSIISLALLGMFAARLSGTRPVGSMIRMALIGGLAIAVGVLAGALIG